MNLVSILLLLLVLGFAVLAIRVHRKNPSGCDGNCGACKNHCPRAGDP
ncbi:MAG: FeoB-associated Cys-rich membrane protein [Clostridiales bacterium]|jgi:hypothetical protein|nr:FeoB-associated Cys-rich membrane protein [Bacillota bacterium]NLL54769.1 FeoB-associated Cys-rich membrane protein [Clostridiales bacterium]